MSPNLSPCLRDAPFLRADSPPLDEASLGLLGLVPACVHACGLGRGRSWIWGCVFFKDVPGDSASNILFG